MLIATSSFENAKPTLYFALYKKVNLKNNMSLSTTKVSKDSIS